MAKKPKSQAAAATQPPPSWPPFKPPLPVVSPLELSRHPQSPDTILTASNFYPRSLCRSYVAFLQTLPLVTTPGKPKRGDAVRVNDRFQVDDAAFADRLWEQTGLKEAIIGNEDLNELWGGTVIGLNPNIRVYRYTKGQFFDCHYDESNNVTLTTTSPPTPGRTTWTLLLYLTSATDGCEGGETVFYKHDRKVAKEEIVVAPETGMLLLHKHGHDCMLCRERVLKPFQHEGREVTSGEKWILRSDICTSR